MVFAKPHFLLFCDASVSRHAESDNDPVGGRWHFVLERIDMPERLEAADGERDTPRERLSLLAVVRGLEALEQPSQVTLVTTSRYVARGLRYGLSEWRETGYIWEHFGVQKPIRNADLWQRIDCAMQYHQVVCRLLESSLAQQVQQVTEEVAETNDLAQLAPVQVAVEVAQLEPSTIDSADVEIDTVEEEVPTPSRWIPAPHFPVRPRHGSVRHRPLLEQVEPVEVQWADQSPAYPELRVLLPDDDVESTAQRRGHGQHRSHEHSLAAVQGTTAQQRPVLLARNSSVRRVPRQAHRESFHATGGQEPSSSWWQTAASWLGWRPGRVGPSKRMNRSLSGSLSS